MMILNRIEKLKEKLQIDEKTRQLDLLKEELSDENIWRDNIRSGQISSEIKGLEDQIKRWQDLFELASAANDDELDFLQPKIDELEQETYFNRPHDQQNAIINIYSGAGGVDAQDWAEMLLKMYLRYAENHNLEAELIQTTSGSEAGIKNATILVSGFMAFGKLREENGVHRLVRLSPFNAKNLRQTSFTLVEVIPEIKQDRQVIIEDKDLKIDVFRASGHGGQSVNTTDSAVRITHLPSGIVVSCQNQRSQLQNKETALRILKSRLFDRMEREHKENINELRGEIASNEWGSQIRSYVLHPYKMVKDHRSGFESSNVEAILNGDLVEMIKYNLEKSITT